MELLGLNADQYETEVQNALSVLRSERPEVPLDILTIRAHALAVEVNNRVIQEQLRAAGRVK